MLSRSARWVRWAATPAVVLAAMLAPAPAEADLIVTFTGEYDFSESASIRFDGTDLFENDMAPLFDLARLDGGSFHATYLVPDVPPAYEIPGFARFEYEPPTPLAVVLLDSAGAVVHQVGGLLTAIDVENRRLQGRPGRPGPRVNEVSFYADPDGLGGINAPPELYGPNRLEEGGFITAYFADGTRPLGDVSIPADGATYLDFGGRTFELGIGVSNGADPFDPDYDGGPLLSVRTSLTYRITGASVVSAAVPEPTSLGLLAVGGLGLIGYLRRRNTAAA